MGFLTGSHDWNDNGEYDIFDRAMDYKQHELINKQLNDYHKQAKKNTQTYSPPPSSSEEKISDLLILCYVFNFFLAFGGVMLFIQGFGFLFGDVLDGASPLVIVFFIIPIIIIVYVVCLFILCYIATKLYDTLFR